MKLSLEDVRHVASLARLALTPEEEQTFQGQLSAILDAVQTLEGVDTTHVEPTSHAVSGETTLRPDEVRPSLGVDKALANAPVRHGTSFGVPKIIE